MQLWTVDSLIALSMGMYSFNQLYLVLSHPTLVLLDTSYRVWRHESVRLIACGVENLLFVNVSSTINMCHALYHFEIVTIVVMWLHFVLQWYPLKVVQSSLILLMELWLSLDWNLSLLPLMSAILDTSSLETALEFAQRMENGQRKTLPASVRTTHCSAAT